MVVAIPQSLVVQRDQEQVGALQLIEDHLDMRRLAGEDFFGQIVHHKAIAAGERADEASQVAAIAHGQRRQLQPGNPALGARLQRGDIRLRQRQAITSIRKALASSTLKRRSAARSSLSCRPARNRASGSGGSARDMVVVMEQLSFARFSVAGHDRGGRVAYRLALDHPSGVERLAVLDILPTGTVWERADARFALAYWPWSLLAQPEPLPERLIEAAPEAVVDDALGARGSPSTVYGPEVRAAYVEALRDPVRVHAICEEYRAAAPLDRLHDDADRRNGRRIACPLLALWSGRGRLSSWSTEAGGPLALWRAWADDVQGGALDAGHFFPEEIPNETADALERFFLATS
jgi:haloacetate dehalogenase